MRLQENHGLQNSPWGGEVNHIWPLAYLAPRLQGLQFNSNRHASVWERGQDSEFGCLMQLKKFLRQSTGFIDIGNGKCQNVSVVS